MFLAGYNMNITSKVQAGCIKHSADLLLSSAWGGRRGNNQKIFEKE